MANATYKMAEDLILMDVVDSSAEDVYVSSKFEILALKTFQVARYSMEPEQMLRFPDGLIIRTL